MPLASSPIHQPLVCTTWLGTSSHTNIHNKTKSPFKLTRYIMKREDTKLGERAAFVFNIVCDCRNLALLRAAGAELVFFSPLVDLLPDGVAGLYFGGGCPERYAEELASNRQLMAAVHAFAEAGGVIYAEYAGLIYLSQSVQPIGSLPCSMGARPPCSAAAPCSALTFLHSEACALSPDLTCASTPISS